MCWKTDLPLDMDITGGENIEHQQVKQDRQGQVKTCYSYRSSDHLFCELVIMFFMIIEQVFEEEKVFKSFRPSAE